MFLRGIVQNIRTLFLERDLPLLRKSFVYVFGALLALSAFTNAVLGEGESKFGQPHALMGRAGTAGPASLDAISLNPAHAGAITSSEVQARWGFSSVDYSQRYPGFEAHSSKKQSLDPKMPIPAFVYKFNRRLGFGGIFIPFPVKQSINVKELPIVILDQVNRVDLDGSGELKALVDMSLGYQVNPDFSLGMNLYYMSIEGDGALIPSGSSDLGSLATFRVATDTLGFGLGFKATFDQVSVGLSTRAYEQVSQSSTFESSLSQAQEAEETGKSNFTKASVFNPLRLGLGYEYAFGSGVMADLVYRRATKGEKRFSVVDFKEKELDVYDTFSLYTGGYHLVNPRLTAQFGFFYEPSAIGPGTKGEDGKTGFGFMDLALNLGDPPLAPMWAVGTGAKYEFDRLPAKRKKPASYRMCIESGLVYAEASVGVDEEGEQPGAYLVRRYMVPFRFSYRF